MAQKATLTASETRCLEAIRSGANTKTSVALRTQVDLKTAALLLQKLAARHLIAADERNRWKLTPQGETAAISIVPDRDRRRGGKQHGEIRPGTSADRLLALLDRPRRGKELVSDLQVSMQRVHQLVVRLSALGKVRLGEPDRPLHVIARSDDPSVLLCIRGERVLSALPEVGATTRAKIGIAAGVRGADLDSSILNLRESGLVENAGSSEHGTLYRLSRAGAEHWQRAKLARRAELPPLPVRSERVHMVLSYLDQEGPTRTVAVGNALGISRASINALMQYLKRKRLVRKAREGLLAAHELTPEGRTTLQAMTR